MIDLIEDYITSQIKFRLIHGLAGEPPLLVGSLVYHNKEYEASRFIESYNWLMQDVYLRKKEAGKKKIKREILKKIRKQKNKSYELTRIN